eukprot:4224048-Amphidinium_carterae.2
MPWPAPASSTRTRTPSRGLSWADQTSDAEETGVSSGRPRMAHSAWQPTAEAAARMQPQLYYLSHRQEPIPLSADSPWAHNPEVEWPFMARAAAITLEYAAEVRQILADGLRDFEEAEGGPPQWNFSSQDCFHGREQIARAEGHLADVSCLWLCADNLEIALTVLADFFPQDPRAFIPLRTTRDSGGKSLTMGLSAGANLPERWRAQIAFTPRNGGSWSFPLSTRWPKIWRPSASL